MKLASVHIEGRRTWGVVHGTDFMDAGGVLADRYADLKTAIAAALDGVEAAVGLAKRYPIQDVQWLPVIPNPEKILCVGLNYETHRLETGRSVVEHPTIFVRFANSQTGHLAPMVRPRESAEFDYEGELAIVIGQPGRYIHRAHAMSYVAGFACYNDGSMRDFQRHTHQFTPGKNFPDSGPFGPWMVTPEELGDPEALGDIRIETRLNGQTVQSAHLDQMIFDIPHQIEYCSRFTRLEAGDVILTGTPGGIGSKRVPPLWLQPGDVVEVEIDKIGVLRNPVTQEA